MFWFGVYIKPESGNKKPNFFQADLLSLVELQPLTSCSSVAVMVLVTCVGFLWGKHWWTKGVLWSTVGDYTSARYLGSAWHTGASH